MARLQTLVDSDDDLPDIADLLNRRSRNTSLSKSSTRFKPSSSANISRQGRNDSPKQNINSESRTGGILRGSPTKLAPKTVKAHANEEGQVRRQRALKGILGNPLLLPLDLRDEQTKTPGGYDRSGALRETGNRSVRQTPSRRAKGIVKYEEEVLEALEEDTSILADKAWNAGEDGGSESSEEEDDSLVLIKFWSVKKPLPSNVPSRRRKNESPSPPPSLSPQRTLIRDPFIEPRKSQREVIDLVSPSPKKLPYRPQPLPLNISASRPSSSSDNDRAAILTFNPPASRYPRKAPPLARPITPPATTPPPSPSKSRLMSPSKKNRIPHAPLRPSIDAFWNATAINEWNDQYSPKKDTLTSPRKERFHDLANRSSSGASDNDVPSPTTSPRKSPTKKDPVAVKARKDFEARKHEQADAFFKELDERITGGKIAELAASTGGVKIVWSKKLNTTAGRANWKRETVRKTGADGTQVVTHRHYASIEFAEKVIDDEQRLLNTLAHEFCHLANYMISGIRGNPHGKEFKEWGRKVEKAFASRGVEVTTKHHYEIEYKYVWECIECGCEYKRHSKSIDTGRHSCGKCKAKLVQTKPAPRNAKASKYQLFVKEHFQTVKKANAGAGHGAVMEVLGKMYREQQDDSSRSTPDTIEKGQNEVNDVVKALGVISIDG